MAGPTMGGGVAAHIEKAGGKHRTAMRIRFELTRPEAKPVFQHMDTVPPSGMPLVLNSLPERLRVATMAFNGSLAEVMGGTRKGLKPLATHTRPTSLLFR